MAAKAKKEVKKGAAKKKAAQKKPAQPYTVLTVRDFVFCRAPDEQAFILADGRVVHDLNELAQSFQDMSNEVFYHHVSGTHNHFGNWVRDVFGDEELADMFNAARNQTEAEVCVLRRIADRIARVKL